MASAKDELIADRLDLLAEILAIGKALSACEFLDSPEIAALRRRQEIARGRAIEQLTALLVTQDATTIH